MLQRALAHGVCGVWRRSNADLHHPATSVTTGSYSEFVDTDEFRPLSQLGKPGKNGYEERDPYKIRDKQNRTVLCARCHEPASPAKQKKIIACDFCELHWHLDCVDPPLVGLPAITRRWKCPIHADSAAVGRSVMEANHR